MPLVLSEAALVVSIFVVFFVFVVCCLLDRSMDVHRLVGRRSLIVKK